MVTAVFSPNVLQAGQRLVHFMPRYALPFASGADAFGHIATGQAQTNLTRADEVFHHLPAGQEWTLPAGLERLITLLLLSVQRYAAIGLILTAKSIARYDRISKNRQFAG